MSYSSVIIAVGGALAGALLVWVVAYLRRDGAQRDAALRELLLPLRDGMQRFDQQLTAMARERASAEGAMAQRLEGVTLASERLGLETRRLAQALRNPGTRGRWGELQLQRVVELAGMREHCDFTTQATLDGDQGRQRPDLVVLLPNGRRVVVDAKCPLLAYLEGLEAEDESRQRELLRQHARQLRAHVEALAAKRYWEQFDGDAPEFVVLFVPGEAFFGAALDQDPGLLEEAAQRRVLLATPTTLIALLRAVAAGWREDRIAEHAAEVQRLGRELYERLGIVATHFAEAGRQLERTVGAYNRAVASLEGRALVSARRFAELGAATGTELPEMMPVTIAPREPAAAATPLQDPYTADSERV